MSTLIFDFDGTIADSMDLAIEIFYEVTGHPPITDPAEIARLRTLPLLKVAREAKISPHQIPRLLLKGRARMHQRMDEVGTFPGLPEVLRQLHKNGHRLLVMSSNSQQNVTQFLKTHGLESYFSDVYGSIGLFSKTRALKKILRLNKLKPGQCFYIGDEIRDMHASQKAKIRPVAVAWGYNDVRALQAAKPFAIAERPADLERIFSASPKV